MDRYVFADEAGNFEFSLNSGASRYFTLCTVTMEDCRVGGNLLAPNSYTTSQDLTRRIGLTTWRSMLTDRQLLRHAVALEGLHRVVADCGWEEGEKAARALALLLSIAMDKALDSNVTPSEQSPSSSTHKAKLPASPNLRTPGRRILGTLA